MIDSEFKFRKYRQEWQPGIRTLRMQPQPDSRYRHSHDFYELIFILSGTGIHHLGEEEYRVSGGDVYLVRPGIVHYFDHTQNLQLINLLYTREFLTFPLLDLRDVAGYYAFFELEPFLRHRSGFRHKLTLDPGQMRYAEELIRQIEEESREQSAGCVFALTSLLMQIICFVSRCYDQGRDRGTVSLVRLSRLLQYLERNYMEPIRLDHMVKVVGMSKTSLLREFHQAMGRSPCDYLIWLRIQKALPLLTDSELSISQISNDVGFLDSNYFARKFKDVMEKSPREWRKSLNS